MSLPYDIDYNKQAVELLPPDKRTTRMKKFVQALLSPLQWGRDMFFGSYNTGSTASAYSSGSYAIYSLVKYNKSVYVSLVSANTASPTDDTKWLKVQDNFIGLNERILYNSQIIVLEYALNKWFGTTFRQPNDVPDIYILNLDVPISYFRVGQTESISSQVYTQSSDEYVINSYSLLISPSFSINIPVAVYDTLGTTTQDKDNTVRSFADKYVTAGILYSIISY